jgi:hypothetical protein
VSPEFLRCVSGVLTIPLFRDSLFTMAIVDNYDKNSQQLNDRLREAIAR